MLSFPRGIFYTLTVSLLAPCLGMAQAPGEREIRLEPPTERASLLDALGLGKPEIGGLRLFGFAVGSFSYNSHIQMIPEFAGGAPALADPGSTNFRFDKFGLGVSKVFAPWLSASAAFEVKSSRPAYTRL